MGTKFQRKTTNQATQVYIGYNVIETKRENSGGSKWIQTGTSWRSNQQWIYIFQKTRLKNRQDEGQVKGSPTQNHPKAMDNPKVPSLETHSDRKVNQSRLAGSNNTNWKCLLAIQKCVPN